MPKGYGSITVRDALYDQITGLAQTENISRAEVVKRAIAVYTQLLAPATGTRLEVRA